MLSPKDPENAQHPTLLRATASFVSLLVLLVVLLFVVAPRDGLGRADEQPKLAGTYMPGTADVPAAMQPQPLAGTEYIFRFMDDNRVEVRMRDQTLTASYRVDRKRVIIEATEDRGRNLSWSFEIVGDRLVGNGIVLTRR